MRRTEQAQGLRLMKFEEVYGHTVHGVLGQARCAAATRQAGGSCNYPNRWPGHLELVLRPTLTPQLCPSWQRYCPFPLGQEDPPGQNPMHLVRMGHPSYEFSSASRGPSSAWPSLSPDSPSSDCRSRVLARAFRRAALFSASRAPAGAFETVVRPSGQFTLSAMFGRGGRRQPRHGVSRRPRGSRQTSCRPAGHELEGHHSALRSMCRDRPLDGADMNKHIPRAIVRLNEPVALAGLNHLIVPVAMIASFHDSWAKRRLMQRLLKNVHNVGEGTWPPVRAGNHVGNNDLATLS